MIIVGINGLIDAGKSSVANILVARFGFTIMKVASPLKNMLRTFLDECGVDADTIERMIEGDLKNVPSEHLAGQTPRWAMQSLGTEWGRVLMGPALWIRAAVYRVRARSGRIVIDDCRYRNEAEAIREELGGQVWKIFRPGLETAEHSSEREQSEVIPDLVIDNSGTLDDLEERIAFIMLRLVHDGGQVR